MAKTDAEKDGGEQDQPPKKSIKLPLIIGCVLMLALGGGGFFATSSGMLDGVLGRAEPPSELTEIASENEQDGGNIPAGNTKNAPLHGNPTQVASFVPLEPLVISLGSGQELAHLRFSGHLEV